LARHLRDDSKYSRATVHDVLQALSFISLAGERCTFQTFINVHDIHIEAVSVSRFEFHGATCVHQFHGIIRNYLILKELLDRCGLGRRLPGMKRLQGIEDTAYANKSQP